MNLEAEILDNNDQSFNEMDDSKQNMLGALKTSDTAKTQQPKVEDELEQILRVDPSSTGELENAEFLNVEVDKSRKGKVSNKVASLENTRVTPDIQDDIVKEGDTVKEGEEDSLVNADLKDLKLSKGEADPFKFKWWHILLIVLGVILLLCGIGGIVAYVILNKLHFIVHWGPKTKWTDDVEYRTD